MDKVNIKLKHDEAGILENMLEEKGLQYSTSEKETRFLPSPWLEIVVPITVVLIEILYDFLKDRKSSTKILIKTDGDYVRLEAKSLKELELRLKSSNERKESES